MTDPLPIFDSHMHLRADFRGVEAAKDFERAGGTAFLLTHTPYDDAVVREGSDYERAYAKTLAMAEAVRSATSIRVYVALGPYPVELLHLAAEVGLAAAKDVLGEGIEIAAKHIAEGRAIAFGEIGRPHFPADPDAVRACNELIGVTMARARELGCAVVLHSEDPTPDTFAEFAEMARRVGLPPERVVKHHATPFTRLEETRGIVPSILAKEDLASRALQGGPRFLLETDYIDDPRRPGAVLGPATVPRKTRAWIERGLLTADDARTIHVELPRRTFGFD